MSVGAGFMPAPFGRPQGSPLHIYRYITVYGARHLRQTAYRTPPHSLYNHPSLLRIYFSKCLILTFSTYNVDSLYVDMDRMYHNRFRIFGRRLVKKTTLLLLMILLLVLAGCSAGSTANDGNGGADAAAPTSGDGLVSQ